MTTERPYSISPGWKILLHDAGIDVGNVLRRAALPADLFAREKASLSTADYFQLWRGLEAEAADPLLPLRLGSAISVEAFDPPVFAALCSANLEDALARLAQYKRLMCAMKLEVTTTDAGIAIELEWIEAPSPPPAALVLTELIFFIQLARIGTREPIRPLAILSPIIPGKRRPFTEFIGASIKRGDISRVEFSSKDAARPFLTANERMWEFFERDLKQRLSQLDERASARERTRAALLELLPSGAVSVEAVAKKLGSSPRTLQRRLKDEGSTFQSVLHQTREALAMHYLKSSTMTGAEISFLLGFDDPNSFFRAFSAWTGTTPEQARRDLG